MRCLGCTSIVFHWLCFGCVNMASMTAMGSLGRPRHVASVAWQAAPHYPPYMGMVCGESPDWWGAPGVPPLLEGTVWLIGHGGGECL